MLNESDFGLHRYIADKLGGEIIRISDDYLLQKSETINRIEKALFTDDAAVIDRYAADDFKPNDLTIVRAANP